MDNIINSIIALVGIAGTFFAAFYGGKKSMDAVKEEIQNENKNKENEKKEQRETLDRIIVYLLKNELYHNYKILDSKGVFDHLEQDTQYGIKDVRQQWGFKTDIYDSTRNDLVKNMDSKIVKDIVKCYSKLYSILLHDELQEINKKDLKKMKSYRSDYRKLLDEIEDLNID